MDFETVLASNNGKIVNYQVSVVSSLYVLTCEPTTAHPTLTHPPTVWPARGGPYTVLPYRARGTEFIHVCT